MHAHTIGHCGSWEHEQVVAVLRPALTICQPDFEIEGFDRGPRYVRQAERNRLQCSSSSRTDAGRDHKPPARTRSRRPADLRASEIAIAIVGQNCRDLDALARIPTMPRKLAHDKVRLLQLAQVPRIHLLIAPHVEQTVYFPMHVRNACYDISLNCRVAADALYLVL